MSTLFTGAPAPVFRARAKVNPSFAFSSLGGRWVVLGFLPGLGEAAEQAKAMIRELPGLFRDDTAIAFLVLPEAAQFDAVEDELPVRWFEDASGELRRLYDAEAPDGSVAPRWVAIDPSQRILAWMPLERGPELFRHIGRIGQPKDHAGVPLHAPVLIVPRVLEQDFCRQLIAHYEAEGGLPSGVMREIDGRTVGVLDGFKRRSDAQIADAADGGHFKAHRDNTTAGTAHRKFAVSINLNAEAFEGGDLRFPEFGPQTYRPPTGGAVVFSCSLLHEATPVTRGVRYATLPFLFDEAGAEVQARNRHLLGGEAAPAADQI